MPLSLDYTLYLRDYVIPVGETHVSTDWEVASDSGFINIVDSSYNDTVNLTSFSNTIAIPTGVTVLYGRSRINTDIRSLPHTNAVVIYNSNVRIDNASVTIDASGNLVINIAPVTVLLPGESHVSTNWIVVDTATDTIVVSSLNDTTNLTSYSVPGSLLTPGNTYRIHVQIETQTSKSATICLLKDYVTVSLFGGTSVNIGG